MEAILGPGGVPEATGRLRQRLLGRMPLPRPWHPHWTDLRVVQACTAAVAPERSLLIVSATPGRVRVHLVELARMAGAREVVHLEPEEVLAAVTADGGAPAPDPLARFDAALVVVGPADRDALHALSGAVVRLLADNAPVVLALSDLSDADARAVTATQVKAIAERLDTGLRVRRTQTVPAPRWRIVSQARMMAWARAAMGSPGMSGGMPGRLRHLVNGIAYAGLSVAANLACLTGARGGAAKGEPPSCSTALFHLVRERPSAAVVPASSTAAEATPSVAALSATAAVALPSLALSSLALRFVAPPSVAPPSEAQAMADAWTT
jgi:hypothetical protein